MKIEHLIKSLPDPEFREIIKRINNSDGQQDACRLVHHLGLSFSDVVGIHAKDVTETGIKLSRTFVSWCDKSQEDIQLKNKVCALAEKAKADERIFESKKPTIEAIWDLENSFKAGVQEWQQYRNQKEQNIKAKLPNFLVLGTPKSATTWLYACLKAHPQVFVSTSKELEFFGTHRYYRGMNWYKKYFLDWQEEKVGGEVSVSYFASPEAPEQISQDLDNPKGSLKLIVMLREPVSRALSCYDHWLWQGEAPRSFEKALRMRFFRQQFIENAHYYRHYQRYLQFFAQEQILILLFEEVKHNPLGILRRVFEFLGVQSDYYNEEFDKKFNVGRSLKNLNLHYLLYHTALFFRELSPNKVIGKKISNRLQQLNNQVNVVNIRVKPQIEPQVYQQLKEEFSLSNQRLAELAGVDLSPWEV